MLTTFLLFLLFLLLLLNTKPLTGFFMPESAIPWPWKVKNPEISPSHPPVSFSFNVMGREG